MSSVLFLKTSFIWLVIAALAIANGAFREKVLIAYLGEKAALPLSGLSLSLIVFLTAYLLFSLIGIYKRKVYFIIGFQWVIMTLIFEFLFAHFVVGKTWIDILQTFNVFKGDLFVVVLVVSFFSPFIIAKLKGIL
ncbi:MULTISPECIES: hypothetical protein [Thiomicrorhabdus]|uniref:DUF2809 domain-containing protein n=1 Tax=Thiomicrorhabdus heinhorstiae TaxID=2748010 RepID=A0ABS0BSA0_9GAMM|nr:MULTISPECIES: hypothetical protein [Thiomicrorhabdus]MBF6056752.1 hypothetical protein [Thiomicrorhabdus heinhorstiae]